MQLAARQSRCSSLQLALIARSRTHVAAHQLGEATSVDDQQRITVRQSGRQALQHLTRQCSRQARSLARQARGPPYDLDQWPTPQPPELTPDLVGGVVADPEVPVDVLVVLVPLFLLVAEPLALEDRLALGALSATVDPAARCLRP